MFDPTAHLRTVAIGGAYRAHLLWATALVEQEDGAWCPATRVALQRALATRDQTKATGGEVDLALRQAISQGLVSRDSTWDRIVLTGAEVEEVAA